MAKPRSPRRRTQGSSRKRRLALSRLLPKPATGKRWLKSFRRSPPLAQAAISLIAIVVVWFAVNGVFQVVRKPTELFFPVSGTLYKTPAETWDSYGTIFRRHATNVMTPELLAALAQVEGSGNPIVRTYWRWSFTPKPFDIYRPASSAVGMYQITDGTFEETRRYCVHDHVVVADGAWNEWHSCWFNGLYSRIVPSHAVEMTAAYLQLHVASSLARARITKASLQQQQDLATVIHLCGAGAGDAYARRGLKLLPGQACGAHDVRGYLARVNAMKRAFARLDASEETLSSS
jgi:hypothetical protein